MVARTITGVAVLMSCLLAACSPAQEEAKPAMESASKAVTQPAATSLAERLASESRPQADRDRDAGRKPAQVIEFLGITPGMSVIDLIAAGGYYTEVLAISVGPKGRVVAHNTDVVLKMRDGVNETALSDRLSGNRLPNVSRLNAELADLGSDSGKFDAAITALNFHDIYNSAGADAAVQVLRTVRGMLKPGGVFGIIDHVGAEGADNVALHRVETARAIEAAEAAGFVVEASSDLLANPNDDHTQGVFAEGLRGNTDRFVLKLRNPAN